MSYKAIFSRCDRIIEEIDKGFGDNREANWARLKKNYKRLRICYKFLPTPMKGIMVFNLLHFINNKLINITTNYGMGSRIGELYNELIGLLSDSDKR